MLAQRTNALIDAVEIDGSASAQAKENFEASPWKERLHIFNEDIKSFKADKKYDLIISNPPFYEDDLRSVDEQKNKAKHEGALNLKELLKIANASLNAEGCFAILLPFYRVAACEAMAIEDDLHLIKKVLVRQTTAHDHFRGILIFSKAKTEVRSTEMAIKNEDGKYTDEFTALLQNYYLHL